MPRRTVTARDPNVTAVVGYLRVSTSEQGDSGAGLAAQEAAIRAEVARRGWHLEALFTDVASGKSRTRRPQLAAALDAIASGRAGTLMVSKLDRLSRSTADFGALLEEAHDGGWNIVIIDLGVDLSTPAGEMVATIMASLAQWERRMISLRTRDALAEKRKAGIRLGRPVGVDPDAEGMIATMLRAGHSYGHIARTLTADGVPTAQGGAKWYPSTVRAVEARLAREAIRA